MKAREAFGDTTIFIDIAADDKNLKKMLDYSGGRSEIPVIVEGDKVTVGFGGS